MHKAFFYCNLYISFLAFGVKPDMVKLVYRYDGRPSGEAFVTFESPELAAEAFAMDRWVMHIYKFSIISNASLPSVANSCELGSRYIELFISSPDQAAKAL